MATPRKAKTASHKPTSSRKAPARPAARSSGARKRPARKQAPTKAATKKTRTSASKRWSQQVTEHSDALDLKKGVFTLRDPKAIPASLKKSAERSSRRKTGAYRSALSMLTFYINRAGETLSKTERARLERAKGELKHLFGRD